MTKKVISLDNLTSYNTGIESKIESPTFLPNVFKFRGHVLNVAGLSNIDTPAANDVCTVGDLNSLYRYSGEAWEEVSQNTGVSINAFIIKYNDTQSNINAVLKSWCRYYNETGVYDTIYLGFPDSTNYKLVSISSFQDESYNNNYKLIYKYEGVQYTYIVTYDSSLDTINYTVTTDSNQYAEQYTTMPTASVSILNMAVQYVGTTTASYTNGYFYKCVSDGAAEPTYSWERVDTQPHQSISGKEDTSNKVTSLSASSTDTEYPSAKAVYDALSLKGSDFYTDVFDSSPIILLGLKKGIYLLPSGNTVIKFSSESLSDMNIKTFDRILYVYNDITTDMPDNTSMIGFTLASGTYGSFAVLGRDSTSATGWKTLSNSQVMFVGLSSDQYIDGKKTFNVLPESSSTPTTNNQLTNKAYVDSGLSAKQDTLVSGTNIKTINNTSILGSGNISISGGGSSGITYLELSSNLKLNTLSVGTYYLVRNNYSLQFDFSDMSDNDRTLTLTGVPSGGCIFYIHSLANFSTDELLFCWENPDDNKFYTVITSGGAIPEIVGTLKSGTVDIASNQTITGTKTFNTLPESSVVPTTDLQLVNKSYVDSKTSSVPRTYYDASSQYLFMTTDGTDPMPTFTITMTETGSSAQTTTLTYRTPKATITWDEWLASEYNVDGLLIKKGYGTDYYVAIPSSIAYDNEDRYYVTNTSGSSAAAVGAKTFNCYQSLTTSFDNEIA